MIYPKLKLLPLFLFLFLLSEIQGQNNTTKSQILSDLIDQNKVAGISTGYLVNENIQWTDAAGFADIDKKIPFTAQTKTRTASIGKSMTAIAIVQLQEQGKLDYDDLARKHLPYFPAHKEGNITIRHLLNHTSGIGGYQNQEFNSLIEYPTVKEAMAVFQDRSLRHKPGEAYAYTTYGYVVLGAIIEAASGLSFEAYLKKYIWEPTGMKNTGVEHFSKKYKNQAQLYERSQDGSINQEEKNNLSNRTPGGGFYSTVEDLLKFGKAILDNKLVTKKSFNLMIKDPGIKQGGSGYGFGWYLYGTNRMGENVIGHSGSQQGAATQLFIWPDARRIVVAMSNTFGTSDDVFNCADQVGGKASEAVIRESLLKKMIVEEENFTSASGVEVPAEVGSLKVPENRSNPKSIEIPIHYIRLKSKNPNPGTALIYLEGGPGASCTWQASNPRYLENWLPHLELSDVILLDQRGTGAGRERVSFTWTKELPENVLVDSESAKQHYQQVDNAALASFAMKGVDLDGYTSLESATDVNVLRQALGYEKWNLLGFSYGSHLGQTYIKYFEEYVDNAVLVGVEGLDQTFKLPLSMDTQFRKIALMAKEDPKVNSAVPSLVDLYEAVVEKLKKEPAVVTINSPITGAPMDVKVGPYGLNMILRIDIGDASDIPVFPRFLVSIYQDDYSMLQWFVQRRIGNFYGANGMSATMDLASGGSPARLQQIADEQKKSMFGGIVNMSKLETGWPAPDLGEEFRSPLTTDTRTLFMSGSLDFNTPPYQAEQLRWGFSKSNHIIVKNAGHEQILAHPKATATIIQFLKGETVDDVSLSFPYLEFIPAVGNPGEYFHSSMLRSVAFNLLEKIESTDIVSGIKWFQEYKDAEGYSLRESEMNAIGYTFLQSGRVKEAIAVFILNVEAFPTSGNVYDSLGEAYLEDGNKELAIVNYQKSVAIDPGNEYGKGVLKNLGVE